MPLIGHKNNFFWVGYCCLQHTYLVDEKLGAFWNIWIETHTGVCIVSKCFFLLLHMLYIIDIYITTFFFHDTIYTELIPITL